MADATKVGNVYLEIRAQITRLSKDLAAAERAATEGATKIQKSIDKSLDFEKMKTSIIGVAAGIYSAFRTINQVIESAKIGATLDKQAKSFDNLSVAAGTSSRAMLDTLKQSSQGMVAEADLMQAAGKAMLMSIPADKISELMKIAAATSKMTGQTITEAFNDITMGVARQSRMILDNLGIIVNVEKANEDYASALGKTSASLSDAEKRQAFMNAVLKAGEDMIKRIGTSYGAMDGVSKATAEWTDALSLLNREIAEKSNPLFEAIAGVLARINLELKTGQAAAAGYVSSVENIDARIKELNDKYGNMESRKSWGYNEPQDIEYRKLIEARKKLPFQGMTDFGRGNVSGRFGTLMPEYYGAKRVSENEVSYDVEERWKSYIESLKKTEEGAKKADEEVKKLNEEIKKLEQEFSDSKTFSGENSNFERLEAQLRSGSQITQMEAKRAETETEIWVKAAQKENETLMDKVSEYERTHKKLVDLTEETARAMQANFSGLFFDAMTGKLKTLEDYAKAVFDSIARMIADLGAQELTRGLFGPDMKGGGLLSGLFGLFGGGAANLPINQPGYPGAETFHNGGVVGSSGGALRAIPASYFNTAPRLHNGLMPDEYPAILQRGERVIKRGGGAGNNVTVNVTAPNGRMDRESLSTLQSGLFAALSRSNRRNG